VNLQLVCFSDNVKMTLRLDETTGEEMPLREYLLRPWRVAAQLLRVVQYEELRGDARGGHHHNAGKRSEN
jgi:hypothetical protein